MAVLLITCKHFTLIYSFITFFFLPQFSFSQSCPTNNISCDPNIEIRHPFYTSKDDPVDCKGFYLIQCDGGGRPTIQLKGIRGGYDNYTVKNISYDHDDINTITVQPQDDPTYYSDSTTCSFLYNFTDPIRLVDLPHPLIIDYFDKPAMSGCKWGKHDFPLLRDDYSYSACENFTFYYSDESNDEELPSPCRASEPPLREFRLSFAKVDDDYGLSLLSAGFSNSFELDPGCFEKNVCNDGGSRKKKAIAIAASVGGTVTLIAILCCIAILYKRRKRLKRSGVSNLLSHSTSSQLSSKKDAELGESSYHTHIFSYEELQEATNGFDSSRELGDGGFGTVYKGTLRDGRTVAVKRLYENNYRRLEQFMNEVAILSRLRHQNLVTLYGCTSRHSRELLLVYEFVPNGTIADHLHGTIASAGPLPWNVRMTIAIETAYALAYLHAVEPQIIHRDVKSNNILLDNNFHVKVADFGLSRLFPLHVTHVSTAPQGTPGYVDPEYHQCYQLTDKSDVYSFGVVLVELISSKPAVDISRSRHEINLANMAVSRIQNRQLDQLVDPLLGYQSDTEVTRMITQVAELAFTCLQSDRDLRPSIKEALEVLKAIHNVGYEAEKSEAAEAHVREETKLLKNAASPFSPDSVTDKWQSSLTTPNNSG